MGEKEEAISLLGKVFALSPWYKNMAFTDPDLQTLKSDERFRKLLS
jgi:hypothetical protein